MNIIKAYQMKQFFAVQDYVNHKEHGCHQSISNEAIFLQCKTMSTTKSMDVMLMLRFIALISENKYKFLCH